MRIIHLPIKWMMFFLVSSVLVACGGGGGGGGGGSSSVNCGSVGPGSSPSSGSGTTTNPFVISLGVSYGGCAVAEADPGPIYQINIPSSGTYTVTQTNGTTDLELWIYDGSQNNIAVIDGFFGGFDESGSQFITAGTYYIEVYNNGPGDGPFTLRVD